ncbi:MAG: nitrate- and nitrite sensing domain-containing protein [Actinobacteria bacterium]|nr:nitrate- and nitrite sensing domain-containing protein [Actinomycetota bacterium]
MLRNAAFRTKLALVTVPSVLMIVLLVVAVAGPYLQRASAAEQVRQRARLATTATDVAESLRNERDATLTVLAAGDKTAGNLSVSDARTAIGSALDAFDSAARATEADARPSTLAAAHDKLATLTDLRSAIDSEAYVAQRVFDAYSAAQEPLESVWTAAASDATDSTVIRESSARDVFAESVAQTTHIRGYVVTRLGDAPLTVADYGQVVTSRQIATEEAARFERLAAPDVLRQYRTLTSGASFAGSSDLVSEVIRSAAAGRSTEIAPKSWNSAMDRRVEALNEITTTMNASIEDAAQSARDDARTQALVIVAVAVAAALASIGSATIAGRSISRRLRSVTAEAEEIADRQLPAVLTHLADGSGSTASDVLPQVTASGRDEIGSLAGSFNKVLRTAVDTSLEHTRRRSETLTQILVSLGRRNQALIDRQLDLIDALEATHDDPQLLDSLFRLDHLVTGMRRNAENLLVLAGDEFPRAWSEPVSILDVIRAGISEIGDMTRVNVEIPAGESLRVEGRLAVDLSHVIAELVENSTAYSPPSTPVLVRGEVLPDGYRIWVLDQGIGMPPDAIDEVNDRLASPPAIDEIVADQVGFQVVARLARRMGIGVYVLANRGRGLAVSVSLPAAMLIRTPPSAPPAQHAPSAPAISMPAIPAIGAAPAPAPAPASAPPPAVHPIAASPRETTPARTPAQEPIVVGPAANQHAQAAAAPTASGLTRRTPGAVFDPEGDASGAPFRRFGGDSAPASSGRPSPATDEPFDAVAEARRAALSSLASGVASGRESAGAPAPASTTDWNRNGDLR